MHAESCPTVKIVDGSEFSSMHSGINVSILEEDLTQSLSTRGTTDKTSDDIKTEYIRHKTINKVVYLNEDTMDCSYAESAGTSKTSETFDHNILSSPELFGSDDDDTNVESVKSFKRILSLPPPVTVEPRKPTQDELVLQSDRNLLTRMNKFLRGIPPPPKYTICQSDCSDLLNLMKQNREYFWADPFLTDDKASYDDATTTSTAKPVMQIVNLLTNDTRSLFLRARSLRNLTNAFDACDQSNSSTSITQSDTITNNHGSNNDFHDGISSAHVSSTDTNGETVSGGPSITDSEISISSMTNSVTSSTEPLLFRDNLKHVTFNVPQKEHYALFSTIDEVQAKSLSWPIIYNHKAPGIHYNRNKYIEDFENLSIKFSQRYVGNETQSTCTFWFTKQAPGSAKKRTLLGKRAVGQSPGKRLSHLARRRRTFSKANLQGMAEKKQLVLNVQKPLVKRGKSPRGKSPRGKSPRGSAKKRLARRLSLEGSSPRKLKIDTSRRALFRSPPSDRAGPSESSQTLPLNNAQKIKRALFSAPQKMEDSTSNESTRKRKSDEEIKQLKRKWAKSCSVDCSYSLENSRDSWNDRYSSESTLIKNESFSETVKKELSEVNRKKLLWAVSEALRSRGINMAHPKFKQYASQLARTVKKYMPDLENRNVSRKPGSTSDRMLKLAKSHVLLVVEAKCD